jgi:hypothetical protein
MMQEQAAADTANSSILALEIKIKKCLQ